MISINQVDSPDKIVTHKQFHLAIIDCQWESPTCNSSCCEQFICKTLGPMSSREVVKMAAKEGWKISERFGVMCGNCVYEERMCDFCEQVDDSTKRCTECHLKRCPKCVRVCC